METSGTSPGPVATSPEMFNTVYIEIELDTLTIND